jgi:hypothetical protein
MHDQLRQDVVVDLRDLTAEERKSFIDLQLSILRARQREAEADYAASTERVKQAALCREQEERALADQKVDEGRQEKYHASVMTREHEWLRPFRLNFAQVTFDEERKQFAATGCGVIAYGDSPEMACDNFDHLWLYGN